MTTSSLPDRAEITAFLHALQDFVLTETDAQRRQIHQRWEQPLGHRVADGYAIDEVRVAGLRPDGQIDLVCARNQSRFRPGDVLCLSRDNPFAHDSVMVSLEKDDETRLVVASDGPCDLEDLLKVRDGWTLDEGFLDLSNYVIGALAEAGDKRVGRERILPLLMGQLQPEINPSRYECGLDMGEALGLNWSQCEALSSGYATDLAHLVQGPPGTGKTRVLATLAHALAREGERVLVTAFTHRAINNVLNALDEQSPEMSVVKIGHPVRADDLLVPNYEQFSDSPLADESEGYVVGATPFATRTSRLSGVEFDTVIFDEASQITLPLAVMGMLAGDKYIFFGDQMQLPPVLTTRLTGGALRDSVFGYLAHGRFDTMLNETYRLNAALTDWPSRKFYGGLLKPAPQVAERRMTYTAVSPRLAPVLDPNEPKVFWDLGHHNNTNVSREEARAVVDLITSLLVCGVDAGEIGVVAPYRAQGRLIRHLLREFVPDTAVRDQIIVDTVERMQGQERDLIILSLTTSDPAYAAHIADFFFQPERLNVAITRPRKKLIIVGSRFVLNAQPADPASQAVVELLENLLESCTTVAVATDPAPHRWESQW